MNLYNVLNYEKNPYIQLRIFRNQIFFSRYSWFHLRSITQTFEFTNFFETVVF